MSHNISKGKDCKRRLTAHWLIDKIKVSVFLLLTDHEYETQDDLQDPRYSVYECELMPPGSRLGSVVLPIFTKNYPIIAWETRCLLLRWPSGV